jgi:hypothetical protein
MRMNIGDNKEIELRQLLIMNAKHRHAQLRT